MITKLLSPAGVSFLGIFSGVAAGLAWFWIQAAHLPMPSLVHAALSSHPSETAKGWDFWTIEVDSLASELKDEKARVRLEKEQLDVRSARLASERQELDKLRNELIAMRASISDGFVEIRADESKNLRMLAQTYSGLTPHGAVAIIRELDDATVVKILSLMKPDVVGPIFEEMATAGGGAGDAKRAAQLSDKLRLMRTAKAGSTP